jgi:hypothetical protein
MLAYICSEAPCEGVHINRLSLTYLSGGKDNNESGILSLKVLPRYECPRHRPKAWLKAYFSACLAQKTVATFLQHAFALLPASPQTLP